MLTHRGQVLASVIVIAHPDPIFREGLRAHLQIESSQAAHLRIETRDDPQWHRNLALLIASTDLLTDVETLDRATAQRIAHRQVSHITRTVCVEFGIS